MKNPMNNVSATSKEKYYKGVDCFLYYLSAFFNGGHFHKKLISFLLLSSLYIAQFLLLLAMP